MISTKTLIAEGAWQAEASSLVDPVGQVIHYEGRVLRGIHPTFVDDVRETLARARRDNWFSDGLVETTETNLATDRYPMILEHRRVPFVTLRAEWPAEGLRQAALCHLDLSARLFSSGYCLKDAHPWNILFDGPTPVFTDFGSIRPYAEMHWDAWLREFHKYFVAPLLLFARGEAALARVLLREHIPGVGNWLIEHSPDRLLPQDRSAILEPSLRPQATFERLRDLVAGLTSRHPASEWTNYGQPDTSATPAELRGKDHVVAKILDRLTFQTAIDVGANKGLHASMCAARGAQVLACDVDESCLDRMFRRAAYDQSPVVPLYLDLVWPIGSTGAFGTIAPAQDRLQCDLAISLALVHHVCLRSQFAPSAFVNAIAAFTRHSAIIEFIPADDVHVAPWRVPAPPGYSSEGFHDALARVFERVERLPSEPAPRELFVCEGKRPA